MAKRPTPAQARRCVLQGAALVGGATLMPPLAVNSQERAEETTKMDDLTADEIRKVLELEPNATCGFVRVTFVSKQSIAPGGLPVPFSEGRPLGSALYFMVTP